MRFSRTSSSSVALRSYSWPTLSASALIALGVAVGVFFLRQSESRSCVSTTFLPPPAVRQKVVPPPSPPGIVSLPGPTPVSANNPPDALPAGVLLALQQPDSELRGPALEAALREWAKSDLERAWAWARAQTYLARPLALAAIVSGAVESDTDRAVTFVEKVSRTDPENADDYGRDLIAALGRIGEDSRAANWACGGEAPNIDWITGAFDHWAAGQPEPALLAASAIEDPTRRRAAVDAAIQGWARSDARSLAECAMKFPAGPERNLAVVTALRSWASAEPNQAADWMQSHAGAIASIPNLPTIAED